MYQHKTDKAPQRKQAEAVLPCSGQPYQPQPQGVPPIGPQAQAVLPCSIPPNQPQAQAVPSQAQTLLQSAPLPPVLPIGIHNVPLPVEQSGQPPNAQMLYGPLVPQNDEDRLLSGRQPIIVMFNHMIQKCYTCDLQYHVNFMCPPPT